MPDNRAGLSLFAGAPPLPQNTTTGRAFWVGSTACPGGVPGSNDGGAGERPYKPFATIDFAIGRCTASRGDTIYVMPGHAETVAGTIAADIAGIRIIGLGTAANRPVLTFDTTTDVLEVSAANIEIANIEFVCNVASHVRFIDLQGGADGCWIHNCMFREGSSTGLSMIEWTGAADDVVIGGAPQYANAFYAPTAGNYDEAIQIASTPTRGHITWNFIFGDWDEGGINNLTGNVATLFEISDNQVTNLLAGQEAIDLVSATTGMMSRNMVSTDAIATAIVDGAMRCNGNLWSSTTDATHGVSVPVTPADTTTANTVLGVLMGTGGITTFPAAAIPANAVSLAEVTRQLYAALEGTAADQNGVATWPTAAAYANNVSIAEVLGFIQDAVRRGTGTTLPANTSLADYAEAVVTNTAATLVSGTTIFTIAGGPIEIVSLVARCVTNNDGTASTLQWSADPTDGAAATFSGASASLASVTAGAMVILLATALTTAPTVATTSVGLSFTGATPTNGVIVGAGIITTTVGAGSSTGTWMHHMRYKPLAKGVTVS